MTKPAGQRPEALATFAEAARADGKKPAEVGLEETSKTRHLPGDEKAEQAAAAKILNEVATGEDRGGEAAADRLPDRTKPR